MNAQHTQGPWSIHGWVVCGGAVDEPIVCSVNSWDAMSEQNRTEARHNLLLIAASPTMLTALERARDWLASYPGGGTLGPNGPYEQVLAAIALATQASA